MSDEEKEAIEWLKRLVKLNKRDNLDDTFAEILLNLIEKQSKEIEKYKRQLDLDFCKVYEINKKWKDKIKAKIEELEKEKNIPQEIDFKAFYRIKDLKNIEIEVLQSLLEKE